MKKKFDAVKFQREVREELSKKYFADRDAFLRPCAGKKPAGPREELVCGMDNLRGHALFVHRPLIGQGEVLRGGAAGRAVGHQYAGLGPKFDLLDHQHIALRGRFVSGLRSPFRALGGAQALAGAQ